MTNVTVEPKIIELANKIKPRLSVEGTKVVVPNDVFASSLPGGMTVETVKEVQEATQQFKRALDVAVGETAITHMAGAPDVTTMFAKTTIGMDRYNAAVDRTAQVSAGVGQPRKQVFGNLTSGVTEHGKDTKKAVIAHLQAFGATHLG